MGKRHQVHQPSRETARPAPICTAPPSPPPSPAETKDDVTQTRDWRVYLSADVEARKAFTKSARYRAHCFAAAVIFGLFALVELLARLIHFLLADLPLRGLWQLHHWADSPRTPARRPTEAQEAALGEKLVALGHPATPQVISSMDGTERQMRYIPDEEVQVIYNAARVSRPPFGFRATHTTPLWNRHVETIFANLRPFAPHRYVRERFKSWDGCTLCFDWAFANVAESGAVKGVLLTVPGLASSSATTYIECFVRHVTGAGYHCAVLNARGMGTTPLDAPRVVDGYNTADIRQAVTFLDPVRLESRFGIPIETPLFLVGHSLGGSMMCKLLGELGRECREAAPNSDAPALCRRIQAAVAVCVPWDFHHTHHNMMRLVSRLIYQQHLTDGLIEYLVNHIDRVRTIPDFNIDELLSRGLRKVQDYDEHIASPHLGFACKEEYYTASQSFPYLPDVRVPLLCLASRNDPIIGTPLKDSQWEAVIRQNPYVCYTCLPCGGHLAFLQGYTAEWAFRGNPMETACTNFFDSLLPPH